MLAMVKKCGDVKRGNMGVGDECKEETDREKKQTKKGKGKCQRQMVASNKKK